VISGSGLTGRGAGISWRSRAGFGSGPGILDPGHGAHTNSRSTTASLRKEQRRLLSKVKEAGRKQGIGSAPVADGAGRRGFRVGATLAVPSGIARDEQNGVLALNASAMYVGEGLGAVLGALVLARSTILCRDTLGRGRVALADTLSTFGTPGRIGDGHIYRGQKAGRRALQ
jgi:hypothetical protein